jgi:biotin synthase
MSSSDVLAIARTLRRDPAREALVALLSAEDPSEREAVRRLAYELKLANVGARVFLRGLVEISNRCTRNCCYCGLRSERRIERYSMTVGEIIDCVRWIVEAGYGSVVLQAGERRDRRFVSFVEHVIGCIRSETGNSFGITLSFGEQERETYRRWREAGADRYLLRIETSSEDLYARLHPAGDKLEDRIRALRDVRSAGYQVGSGVMIGLPGQTIEDLADDLLFLHEIDVDMIGMGPYLVHGGTPTGAGLADGAEDRARRLELALRMISVARILMPDVNIAATTALQALHPTGRELGLLAGANVMMPIVTPPKHRRNYVLYDLRPCTSETASDCHACLGGRVTAIGETLALRVRGDSPHATARMGG